MRQKIARLKGTIRAWEVREHTHAQAKEGIAGVIQLAEGGDELSFVLLLIIAVLTIDALDLIAKQRPHLVRRYSRNRFVWPALISRKRSLKKANEEWMKHLQLGEGSLYSRRRWQLSATSTKAAFRFLIKHLSEHRWPNRFLTKAAKKKLFERLWKQQLASGLVPENVEKLAVLGKRKATKKPKYCKELHKATRDANVRAEIKNRIWDAFDNVVAG